MYTTENGVGRWQTLCYRLLKGAMTDLIDDREIFMKGIDYSYYDEEADNE